MHKTFVSHTSAADYKLCHSWRQLSSHHFTSWTRSSADAEIPRDVGSQSSQL